jgi:hypothetical protein
MSEKLLLCAAGVLYIIMQKRRKKMFDILSYSEKNDVEVSVRPGHDGRAVWEVFLRDRNLGLTEFSRIIDIELNGKPDRDAYIASRCEEMMEKIRSKRKEISAENRAAGEAGGSFFVFRQSDKSD